MLQVPRESRLSVDTVSAPISVTDVKARLDLNCVSGDLSVKGSPREVKLNTVSGDIKLEDGASVENADLNTVSGSIERSILSATRWWRRVWMAS